MDAHTLTLDISEIKDHVSDLAEEDVGGSELFFYAVSHHQGTDFRKLTAISPVRITVNEAHCLARLDEARSAFEDREIVSIANELCIVVVDDGAADQVGSGRKVDHCRSCRRPLAAVAASAPVASTDGLVDGIRVVRHCEVSMPVLWLEALLTTITFGPKFLHIAEDLVALVRIEGRFALVLDGLHPVRGLGGRRRQGEEKKGLHRRSDKRV